MNIPDKAVEAAARERYERIYPLRKWGNASDHVQGNFRREATRALEAAAPYIAAQENLAIAHEMPGLTHAQARWLANRLEAPDAR